MSLLGLIGLMSISTITATSICTFMCEYSGQACSLICGDIIQEMATVKGSLGYYQSVYISLLNDLIRPIPLAISGIVESNRPICNDTVELLYKNCQYKLEQCESQILSSLYESNITPIEVDNHDLLVFMWSMYFIRCYILYGNLKWVSDRDTLARCA